MRRLAFCILASTMAIHGAAAAPAAGSIAVLTVNEAACDQISLEHLMTSVLAADRAGDHEPFKRFGEAMVQADHTICRNYNRGQSVRVVQVIGPSALSCVKSIDPSDMDSDESPCYWLDSSALEPKP